MSKTFKNGLILVLAFAIKYTTHAQADSIDVFIKAQMKDKNSRPPIGNRKKWKDH